jgi:hypothetical protein
MLGVGEALVSCLDAKGVPLPVQRCLIRPPASRMGAITPAERGTVMGMSPVAGRYDEALDRESAFEMLTGRVAAGAQTAPADTAATPSAPASGEALNGADSTARCRRRCRQPRGRGDRVRRRRSRRLRPRLPRQSHRLRRDPSHA